MLAVLILLPTAAPPQADAAVPGGDPPSIDARAWILIDAGDATRLAARDPRVSLPMASTTKLMTAYLTLRRLSPRRTLEAPAYHALPGESLMGLQAGESVSVHDLLYGMLLPSGNDAAAALAVGVAGSIPAFVDEMNAAARRLGLRDTSYANPIGLDAPGEYSSPRDLAKLTLRLRHDALFRRIVDTPSKVLAGAHPPKVFNRNVLVARVPWITGVKTGYTAGAGNVLVATGVRKGVTLLSVVMGAPTETTRDADTLSLLRWGFSLYRRTTPVEGGERLGRVRVDGGARPTVGVVASRPVSATVRRDERARVRLDVPRSVDAPVHRRARLGAAAVTVDGEPVGRVRVLAARAVAHAAPESAIARADEAVPGPRAALWALVVAAVAIVIGVGVALVRRRTGSVKAGMGSERS